MKKDLNKNIFSMGTTVLDVGSAWPGIKFTVLERMVVAITQSNAFGKELSGIKLADEGVSGELVKPVRFHEVFAPCKEGMGDISSPGLITALIKTIEK